MVGFDQRARLIRERILEEFEEEPMPVLAPSIPPDLLEQLLERILEDRRYERKEGTSEQMDHAVYGFLPYVDRSYEENGSSRIGYSEIALPVARDSNNLIVHVLDDQIEFSDRPGNDYFILLLTGNGILGGQCTLEIDERSTTRFVSQLSLATRFPLDEIDLDTEIRRQGVDFAMADSPMYSYFLDRAGFLTGVYATARRAFPL